MTWKAANSAPRPAAACATWAIHVEFRGGSPTCSRTPSVAMPRVSQTTIPTMSHSVVRPNRSRPALSSWPSWAIADEGASTPVARAMPTGKATSTPSTAECPAAGAALATTRWTGAARVPRMITTDPTTTKLRVIIANTARPPCPSSVMPATAKSSTTASPVRAGASLGTYAMIADAPAATLIAMVRA